MTTNKMLDIFKISVDNCHSGQGCAFNVQNEYLSQLAFNFMYRMQYEDFIQEFTRVDVCNLSPASMRGTRGNKKWIENIQQGRWQKGASAGGCRNFPGWLLQTFQKGKRKLIKQGEQTLSVQTLEFFGLGLGCILNQYFEGS